MEPLPRNYKEAAAFLDGRQRRSTRHKATQVIALDRGNIGIQLYETMIITYSPDGYTYLACYDSWTTNNRRRAAGVPLIAAIPTGIPLRDRIEVKRRWIVPGYPAGLPANTDLTLDQKGRPVGGHHHKERILTKDLNLATHRRRALRWMRQVVRPVFSLQASNANWHPGFDGQDIDVAYDYWVRTCGNEREQHRAVTTFGNRCELVGGEPPAWKDLMLSFDSWLSYARPTPNNRAGVYSEEWVRCDVLVERLKEVKAGGM